MRKRIFYIALYILLSALSTNAQQKIRIDPEKAYGGNVSEYFDSVEYIPLENTKESAVGDISNMLISESSIIASDIDTHAIYFFETNGKYIKKIKYKGNVHPLIQYDNSNTAIDVFLWNEVKNKYDGNRYSFRGKKIDGSNNLSPNLYLFNINKDFSLLINPLDSNGENYTLAKNSLLYRGAIYKNYILKKKILPLDFNIVSPFFYYTVDLYTNLISSTNPSKDGSIWLSTPLLNELYQVIEDSVYFRYQVIFPNKYSYDLSIFNSFRNNIEQGAALNNLQKSILDSFTNNMQLNTQKVFSIGNIVFSDSLLFFKINRLTYVNLSYFNTFQDVYNLIYNLKSRKTVGIERLTPDSASLYLPIIGSQYSIMNGIYWKGNNAYSVVSSLAMFSSHEATKNKKPQYPPVLQEYFKTQNRKSNPVIVKMKLKDF